MSKEQHIKAPWILGGSAAWSEAAKDRGPIFICDIREGTHVPVGTNQANARFIVRAVNSHETLVEALRALEPYLSTEAQLLDAASLNEGRASGFDMASVKARAALALAAKESQ